MSILPETLKIVGEISGIAGISSVVFLSIVKAMIAGFKWPAPDKKVASRLMNRMLVFAFLLAIMGMATWLADSTASKVQKLGEEVIQKGGKVRVEGGGQSSDSQSRVGVQIDTNPSEINFPKWEGQVWNKLMYGDQVSELDLVVPFSNEKNIVTDGPFYNRLMQQLSYFSSHDYPFFGREGLVLKRNFDTPCHQYYYFLTDDSPRAEKWKMNPAHSEEEKQFTQLITALGEAELPLTELQEKVEPGNAGIKKLESEVQSSEKLNSDNGSDKVPHQSSSDHKQIIVNLESVGKNVLTIGIILRRDESGGRWLVRRRMAEKFSCT